MTMTQRVPWLSIVIAGIAAFVVSFIGSFLVVCVYAFSLGMQARGAPDPERIGAFARQVVPLLSPVLLSLLVVIVAYRVVRRARSPQLWHGVLVGVVAVLPSLVFIGVPNPVEVGGLLLPPAGGLLGAYFALRRARVSLS
ncbi:MAG: hypothetical protein ABI596_06130 [Pyrinomonadaceae bacterium]